MKKIVLILVAILIVLFFAISVYTNKEKIFNYLDNKEWTVTETVGTIQLSNYFDIAGTTSNIMVIGNNYIKGYSSEAKENFDESVSLKSAVSCSRGDYCIVGEKDGSKIYMINGNVKIWENTVNGNILDVSVNKNGYSTVIYKQTGYKSVIKVMKPDGTEVFTNYLASTYAIDTEISNDNKNLAIAEISTDGINVESNIKLIDMNNANDENVKKIELEDNLLITDIAFTDKNELLILTDNSAYVYNNTKLVPMVQKFDSKVYLASIENMNNLVTISKKDNGLFDVKYFMKIYERKDVGVEEKEYEIDDAPLMISVGSKNIAIIYEDKIEILNMHGKVTKRTDIIGNVKNVYFFNGGNSLAIVLRDKIELIKL